jgi:rhodanese-related sulfurtransferase
MTTMNAPAASMTAAPASVTPRDAARLLERGEATIVDVREPDEHRREHVAGAALHPSSSFTASGIPAARPGSVTLILCRSGNRAGKVAGALRGAGRTDVCVVEGGIMGWQSAGLPVVTNAKAPLPLVRQVMITVGIMLMAFTALAATFSPWFLVGTGFMGAGLVFAGATGICAMATVLSKMPWNRPPAATGPTPGANACSSVGSRSCCG